MKITFLGTGTSQGVPVIGCQCDVCQSTNPKDQRLRTSALVETNGETILIDAGPDFRQQLLRAKVSKLSAILLTHEHNDHIIGMDDVRPLNFSQRKAMPVYAEARVQKNLLERFAYVFAENPYPGAPRLLLKGIETDSEIQIGEVTVTPIRAMHGQLPVFGFRINDFTYLTDVSQISPTQLGKVKGTKILALDALHHNKHHSHLTLEEAIALAKDIQPEKAYFIHMSHRMGLHDSVNEILPENMQLAYDGLVVEV